MSFQLLWLTIVVIVAAMRICQLLSEIVRLLPALPVTRTEE